MARPGYNIFVSGEPGTGRLSLARHYLEAAAREGETPTDWLYVNQFENLREPIALALPAGLGLEFQADMEHLVDSLFATFPAAFEHPAYQHGKAGIEREFSPCATTGPSTRSSIAPWKRVVPCAGGF